MPNDAKLGLLAGVAGVVTAAVLFFQNHPVAPTPNPAAPAVPPATTSASAPAPAPAKPPPIFGKKPDRAKPPADRTDEPRLETEARPVSRAAGE
ncbi:MAG TPA: hypothetical protein VKE74_04140 [Gemmataceae bacterium]|nr:hypothetical protein [Gemmataceae bacterium]